MTMKRRIYSCLNVSSTCLGCCLIAACGGEVGLNQPGASGETGGVNASSGEAYGVGGAQSFGGSSSAGGTATVSACRGITFNSMSDASVSQCGPVPVNLTGSNCTISVALTDLSIDWTGTQVLYLPYSQNAQELPQVAGPSDCGGLYGGWYYADTSDNQLIITLCPCSCVNATAGTIDVRLACVLIIN